MGFGGGEGEGGGWGKVGLGEERGERMMGWGVR